MFTWISLTLQTLLVTGQAPVGYSIHAPDLAWPQTRPSPILAALRYFQWLPKKGPLTDTFWGLATYAMQLLLFPNFHLYELAASVSHQIPKHSSPLTLEKSTVAKERLA
jgi:hypothetical protein